MPSSLRLWTSLTVLSLAAACGTQNLSPPPSPYHVGPTQEPFPPTEPPTVLPVPTPRPRLAPPPVQGESPYPYPTPPMPEVGPNEVAGTVLSRGEPAQGIQLTVIGSRGRTYRVTTDAHGVYRVANAPAGQYYAHFYNDRDNNQVGYWRTRDLAVTDEHGAAFPAWDVFLIGMKNTPGQGAVGSFPLTVTIEPYPLAITYRFRIHNAGGPGGKPLYISDKIPAKGVTGFTYSGANNQDGGTIGPGLCLWGYQWESGIAGEGGCLFQDINIMGSSPSIAAEPDFLSRRLFEAF